MLFRVYSGLPLGPAFEQMWVPCYSEKKKKRGDKEKWRREKVDKGLLYHILQVTV